MARITAPIQVNLPDNWVDLVVDRLKEEGDVQLVRHGKWIETEQPIGWGNVSCATCSECEEDFVLDEWTIDDVRKEMHYCPNRGARMDLEEDV